MLQNIRQSLLVSALTVFVAGSGFVTALSSAARAVDTPVNPSDIAGVGVPGGVAMPPMPTAADLKTPEPKTSDGISLGVPPALTSDVGDIERQAEETAAKASMDDAKREQEHNRKSYDRAASGLLPLSPDQVRDFMNRLESTQAAAVAPVAGPPRGEFKVAALSLDPGTAPPSVNLAAGYVTTIAMVDQTGEPWPIADVGVGGNFEVTPTQAGSHVVRIVPLTRIGTGNLSILLKDLPTPVIFNLVAGSPTYHMRYDARIPKMGPNAKLPIIQPRARAGGGLQAGDQMIAMILENAPPKEARRVKVGGVDARTMAWQVGERLYVRTPLSLLSPAWNASASSSDGTTVYEIGDAPVLLMSDNGSMVRARLIREDGYGK